MIRFAPTLSLLMFLAACGVQAPVEEAAPEPLETNAEELTAAETRKALSEGFTQATFGAYSTLQQMARCKPHNVTPTFTLTVFHSYDPKIQPALHLDGKWHGVPTDVVLNSGITLAYLGGRVAQEVEVTFPVRDATYVLNTEEGTLKTPKGTLAVRCELP